MFQKIYNLDESLYAKRFQILANFACPTNPATWLNLESWWMQSFLLLLILDGIH